MRTPTKHSTNVDTAPSVVPVPTVVSRPTLASTTPESVLSTTIRNSPVRLLLNSTATISDTLISVQPQFAIFPSVKLSSSEQVADRPVAINSGGTVPKKTDFDSNCGVADTTPTHFSPITIITPNKMSSSPQIMPLVQNTELKSFARPSTLSSGASFSTVVTTANAKILPIAVPVDTVPHPSPNLLTTLRPMKSDSANISSLSSVQVSTASQSVPDPIVSSTTQFLKASSLVSHSSVPAASVEANQPTSLISVSKSGQSTIRPAPRIPIAVAPNRPTSTGVALSRPSIGRQPIIAPLSPIHSPTCPLTPSRKRARKQQLLAPQGTETPATATATGASSAVVNIVEMVTPQNDGAAKSSIQKVITSSVVNSAATTVPTSTPNIEAALQSSNPSSTLPIVTVANSSSPGSGQVLNLRFLQVRTTSNSGQSGKEVAPHLEQVAISPATPIMTPQFHGLVVTSSSSTASDETQPPVTSAPAPTTTASIAASLVTASSFHSGSLASQQSMYVFPATAVATPLRTTSTATASVGNVVQVRFRTPTPTKPLLSNATAQQTVRTVLSQPVTSNTVQGGFHVALQPTSPPLRKTPSVDWPALKPSTSAKQALPFAPATATSKECIHQVPSTSINTISKATPMDSSGQPTVPILRVSDPNNRNCFESLSNANTTTTSPCKRPRKQSNSGSVIKKQCTWELRTDPMDSNKSVWRSPLERADQQSPSRSLQNSETVNTTLKKEVDMVGTADSVIHGRPVRMRLYKPSHLALRFNGLWRGPKTGHFLRSSEIRQRPEGPQSPSISQFRASSTINRHSLEPGLRRRRPRDQVQYEQLEVFEVDSSKNPDFFALSELLELRNQQAEMGFINHPVDTTSPLDLNCWRIILCLKNCEKLIGVEYEKLSTLSRAFDRTFRKQCECCSGQGTQGGEASSMRDFIEDQQQELITRLFLQAIPPASPSTSESRAADQEGIGRKKRAYDKPMQCTKAEMDLKVVKERTTGLLQRIRALMEGLRRVSQLSFDLITGHRESVIAFVDDLEFLQQNGSARSSTPSSSRSLHHRQDEGSSNSAVGSSSSSSSSDTEDEVETSEVRMRTKPLGSASSSRLALPPTASCGRRRSASPMAIKSSSPVIGIWCEY
uniref:Uncharacterized protein n=1 Tax=Echinococcus granulosus TaxID=6210 RepID=A0A068WZI6_ECHGR|nr:hypothetical protein EgrG_000709200 [Echinococcus granulosus]